MAEIPCSWDVSCEVCPDFAEWDETIQNSALWLASTYLWAATGRRYGTCPVTVRPAQGRQCGAPEPAYLSFAVTPGAQGLNQPGGPFLWGGRWFNGGCATYCCGQAACAVVLAGPVASIGQVTVDGEVVPAGAYRVDLVQGAYLLVRVDGECWPACQSFTAGPGDPGSFEVTYNRGVPIPEALAIATALLACEYGKYLQSGACKLPARMTRLSRQGVEVEVESPDANGELTGIKQVDAVVRALNPSGRQRPPAVLSPDLTGGGDRITVVQAGA